MNPHLSGTKRFFWSAILAVPFGLTATAVSDSAMVSDGFRYVFSPGTMIASRWVGVQASHRGLKVFLDIADAYARSISLGVLLNCIFYGLLIFGIMTVLAAKSKAAERSSSQRAGSG